MKARPLLFVVILLVVIACQLTPQAASAPTHPAATQTVELTPTAATPTQPLPPTAQPQPSSPTPQPVWEWPRSTPEEQGLSSSALAGMLEAIQQEKQNIHSVLVIRHGVLVLEAYVHPFNAQTRHGMYSVTKSVTSALVVLPAEKVCWAMSTGRSFPTSLPLPWTTRAKAAFSWSIC